MNKLACLAAALATASQAIRLESTAQMNNDHSERYYDFLDLDKDGVVTKAEIKQNPALADNVEAALIWYLFSNTDRTTDRIQMSEYLDTLGDEMYF